MFHNVDIAVIGGGPAGVAAAIGGARAGASVILFERANHKHPKPGEILEPMIKYPLRELGVWPRFLELGFLPVAGNLAAWDDDTPVEADGMLNPHGHGYLVDRGRMESWLIEEARSAGVKVLTGERRIEVQRGTTRLITWQEGDRRHEAHPGLIIEATGRGRGVIGDRGRRVQIDSLIAILAYLPDEHLGVRDQRVYIEAIQDGWWYSAPLPDGVTVVAFLTDADLIPHGSEAREAFFWSRLATTRITRMRYPITPPSVRLRVHPASSTQREVVFGHDWVALGDAAATYDPLSGLGVAAALTKGAALSRLIVNSDSICNAVSVYGAAEEAAYADYLDDRRRTYSRVGRWRRHEFWARRN